MYPNYRIVLDLRRPKNNSLFPVKVRVTLNRVQKYYPIGLDLNVSDFERIQNGSVRNELRIYKNKIADWENRAKGIIHQMDTFSFEEFKSRLYDNRSVKVTDVYALFDQKIDKLKSQEKISTSSIYNDAKNSLKRFKSKLNLMDVTSDFLKNYESYMISEDRSVTTISIYIRSLRSIYNQAIDAEMVDRKYYPFGKNKYQPKAPRNIKKALTIEQIKSIIDYKVEEGSNQQLAKDMWLLSYYCNGMNIKDIINLRFSNIEKDSLYFERLKTLSTNQNPKPIVVSLIPQAQEIIKRWKQKKRSPDDFVFPIIKKSMTEDEKAKVKHQFIKTINKYMKRIGTEIGYDKPLTTYSARHSYATILKRSGAPLSFISEALGHKSLLTTESYLDSFEDETRRKYAEMLVPK
jgi:integrase